MVAVPSFATPTEAPKESFAPTDRFLTGVQPAWAAPARPRNAAAVATATAEIRWDTCAEGTAAQLPGTGFRDVRVMFLIYLVGALAGIVVFSAIGILGH